ncbi:Retrovirus-related Pol polyprotein from transposon 17.6 [Nosema granulosis]|uniref:Retrovirus-related Pol polyprotein from transposon 17.6 n=1 Tax=Nosema granulosis TaxID=83296 RepID=A0A9P6GVG6_9MICR|nr:Retrovirus-related Pol polyprotein from transposon 17.6 [Nosema granulosis]
MVPEGLNSERFIGSLFSACGTKLSIQRKLINLKGTVLGNQIEFSPLITMKEPRYIIIEADVLKNKPELLTAIINNRKQLRVIQQPNKKLEKVMSEFTEMFQDKIDKHKLCTVKQHTINTVMAVPIYCRQGRIPVYFQKQIEEEIKKGLDLGIIRESDSPWNSRIRPVPKDDGSVRMCIDYRPLNSVTVRINSHFHELTKF